MNSRLKKRKFAPAETVTAAADFLLLVDVVAHLHVPGGLRGADDAAGVVVPQAEEEEVGGEADMLAGEVGTGEARAEGGLDTAADGEVVHERRLLHRLARHRPESPALDVRARDREDDARLVARALRRSRHRRRQEGGHRGEISNAHPLSPD
jgi:hypothetical protein